MCDLVAGTIITGFNAPGNDSPTYQVSDAEEGPQTDRVLNDSLDVVPEELS